MPKKLEGDLWDFSTSILSQNSKKIEGGPFEKKSLAMPENTERGTIWSRLVLYVTQETFLVQFLGPTVQFGVFLKFCRTFRVELFWPLQVYRKKFKKHWRKVMTIVDSFL